MRREYFDWKSEQYEIQIDVIQHSSLIRIVSRESCHRSECFHLDESQRLCHQICDIIIGGAVNQFYLSASDLILDEMISSGDVLRSITEFLIFNDCDAALTVGENCHRSTHFDI